MNAKEIRQWLCNDIVGRMDLIGTDGSDNGADRYLKAGQRFLDRMFDFPRGFTSFFKRVPIDSWNVKFEDARAVKEVYANNASARVVLDKKSRSYLMETYASTIVETDSGTPLYWAPAELRGINAVDKDALAEFFRFIIPGDKDFNGIVFLPPTDEELVIEVYGQFYTEWFKNDKDSTWWSVHHPEMLVWAGAYIIEISYRNREGANDWLSAITEHARQLDFDTVSTEIAGVNQMEG